MFEQLKKKSMKVAFARILLFVAMIAIILVASKDGLLKLYEGPKNLDSLEMDELPGSYVKADIKSIYSNFAEYYETDENGSETVTDQYYIIPVGEKEFIALEIDVNESALPQKIYEETYEWIYGERENLTTSLQLTGTIDKMDADIYDYYKDWFVTSGYFEDYTQKEIDSMALPYILRENDGFVLYVALLIMLGFLLCAIFIFIKCIFGFYLTDIKKFIKNNESYMNEERLENDYLSATHIGLVSMGKICIYYFIGSTARILANKDIVWAYMEQVSHRTYGIETRVSKYLNLFTRDKRRYRVPMKKVDDVKGVLDHLSHYQPHIVIGFSEELKKCYNKDFNTFINLKEQQSNYSNTDF